ncbi:MAG: hypothetical protein KKI08_01695 [Armatimonadetes bacterium]|nr:hypothetical protein [Armatimonadota bacterium]
MSIGVSWEMTRSRREAGRRGCGRRFRDGPGRTCPRPSDGQTPDAIVFVRCAGARDHSLGVPYCARVCCLHAIQQAMRLSGSLPTADITIHYLHIRALGKGYEQFCLSAQWMLPRGTHALKLSKMNMSGMGTGMMTGPMSRNGAVSLGQLLRPAVPTLPRSQAPPFVLS